MKLGLCVGKENDLDAAVLGDVVLQDLQEAQLLRGHYASRTEEQEAIDSLNKVCCLEAGGG